MVRMQMNDIEFFCRQQTHPNNVLLHDIVLVRLDAIICCLQMVRMQMNASSFVVSKPS